MSAPAGPAPFRFTSFGDLATPNTDWVPSYGQAAYAVTAVETFQPWMPCPGNHEVEFYNGPQGFTSYLSRYELPDNHVPGFAGRWYPFQVGSVLFISLDANDVIYQDMAAFVAGPDPLVPAAPAGNPPIEPGTSLYLRGYSGGAQTRWLERRPGPRGEIGPWSGS